jgi:hypothetical protein
VQEVWNETFPVVVGGHSIWGWAAQENVEGIKFGPDTTPYWNQAYLTN